MYEPLVLLSSFCPIYLAKTTLVPTDRPVNKLTIKLIIAELLTTVANSVLPQYPSSSPHVPLLYKK